MPLQDNPARIAHPLDIPPIIAECLKASFLKDVRFSKIYPNEPIDGPVIVWRMVRRVLGKEGKETKKPRIRGWEVLNSDQLVTFWGQWTTALFQFDIFAPSDQETDDLMRRFELFMMESRAALALAGVDSFIFDEQIQDYALPSPKELPVRSIRYQATMTTLYPAYSPRIHQIALQIASADKAATQELTRASNSSTDRIEVPVVRIISIGNTEDTIDYIAGVDYDLIDNGDRTATVSWLAHGLHPEGGAPYYIRYSTLTDPLSFAVAG